MPAPLSCSAFLTKTTLDLKNNNKSSLFLFCYLGERRVKEEEVLELNAPSGENREVDTVSTQSVSHFEIF